MLSCRDVSSLASDYLNRDLPWRRRLAIRLHLMMCDGCTRYIQQMRTAVALLRRMGTEPSGTDPAASPDRTSSADEHARSLYRSVRRR